MLSLQLHSTDVQECDLGRCSESSTCHSAHTDTYDLPFCPGLCPKILLLKGTNPFINVKISSEKHGELKV